MIQRTSVRVRRYYFNQAHAKKTSPSAVELMLMMVDQSSTLARASAARMPLKLLREHRCSAVYGAHLEVGKRRSSRILRRDKLNQQIKAWVAQSKAWKIWSDE